MNVPLASSTVQPLQLWFGSHTCCGLCSPLACVIHLLRTSHGPRSRADLMLTTSNAGPNLGSGWWPHCMCFGSSGDLLNPVCFMVSLCWCNAQVIFMADMVSEEDVPYNARGVVDQMVCSVAGRWAGPQGCLNAQRYRVVRIRASHAMDGQGYPHSAGKGRFDHPSLCRLV
jgi:hypothetical protein